MFTRRALLLSGGAALGAASLFAGAAGAAAFAQSDVLSIASAARPIPAALQGQRHLVLSGDRWRDLLELEGLLRAAPSATLRLSLDPADAMIFEIAQSRTPSRYQRSASVQGLLDYRRATRLGA